MYIITRCSLWLVMVIACGGIYLVSQYSRSKIPDPPGYREMIKRRSSGPSLHAAISSWNRDKIERAYEDEE